MGTPTYTHDFAKNVKLLLEKIIIKNNYRFEAVTFQTDKCFVSCETDVFALL